MDFVKSYFGKNEPLTSWTLLSLVFFQISTDLEKKGDKSVQLVRRSFLSKYFLQNPYFSDYRISWCELEEGEPPAPCPREAKKETR